MSYQDGGKRKKSTRKSTGGKKTKRAQRGGAIAMLGQKPCDAEWTTVPKTDCTGKQGADALICEANAGTMTPTKKAAILSNCPLGDLSLYKKSQFVAGKGMQLVPMSLNEAIAKFRTINGPNARLLPEQLQALAAQAGGKRRKASKKPSKKSSKKLMQDGGKRKKSKKPSKKVSKKLMQDGGKRRKASKKPSKKVSKKLTQDGGKRKKASKSKSKSRK